MARAIVRYIVGLFNLVINNVLYTINSNLVENSAVRFILKISKKSIFVGYFGETIHFFQESCVDCSPFKGYKVCFYFFQIVKDL